MSLIKHLIHNHQILYNLINNDFRNRYLGNHLGIIWAFIQPLIMVSIYYFVFTKGFKTPAIADAPFLIWLLAGLVPWFLFADAITSSASSIVDQSYLVKKIVFEVKLLPIIKIGSALMVNFIFWLLLLIVCCYYGYYPKFYWFALLYYLFGIIAFSLSLSFLLSALMVFIRDVAPIINIFIQIFFWLTPIFWNQTLLTGKLIYIIKLNPFAYVINGIRDTLILHQGLSFNWLNACYFWILTGILFYGGNHVFNKLRPHFADVL